MRNPILVLFFFFSFLVLSFLYATVELGYDEVVLRNLLLATAFFTLIFVFQKESTRHLEGQYVRPSYFFVFGYLVVFFQNDLDIVLGNLQPDRATLFIDAALINKAAFLSLLGLLAFFLGHQLFFTFTKPLKIIEDQRISQTNGIKIFFLAVSVLFFVFNTKNMLRGDYTQESLEANAGTLSFYIGILYRVSFMTLFVMQTRLNSVKPPKSFAEFFLSFGMTSHISLGLYLVLSVFAGGRSAILSILLLYLFSFLVSSRIKFRLPVVIPLFLLGAVVFSVLGFLRKEDNTASVGEIFRNELIERESICPYTAELAGSQYTLLASMASVPGQHPYLHGSTFVRQLLSAIPFSARGTELFLSSEVRYRSTDFFITHLIQGDNYSYGSGTSVVADLYLNFGGFGVGIMMLLFGILVGKLEFDIFCTPARAVPLFYFCLATILFSFSIPLARSSLLAPFNFVIFTFIFSSFFTRLGKNTNRLSG